MRRSLIITAVLAMSSLTVPTAASAGGGPFTTGERPYLVGLVPGVQIQPIISAGDVVGGYQMSGVPDGIGWYVSPDGVEVLFNHELHPDFDPSGARVSHVTLDMNGAVTAAGYVIDGTEGYEWFCSSTLTMLGGTPWYTTGEESKHSPRYATALAINAETGRVLETPWFGHFGHENVVPVEGLSKAYLGLSEDGFSEYSQYFAYMARTFKGALHGRQGSLYVWVPNRPVPDGNPSPGDLAKGDRMRGHFERIPHAEDLLPLQLEKLVQRMGAFDFDRIEDQIGDPNEPGTIFFAETGRAHADVPRGRVYRLDVDPAHPRHATLRVVLDSSDGDDIFSPDNLGISDAALVIQEDRNWKRADYNRVLVYDLATQTLTPVARTDPDQAIIDEKGLAAWESSGVVSVADVYGQGWWLLNVQAHYTEFPVPDQTLVPGSATGEGGQLELVFIPGT
jgi:hypothetical protein